MIRTMAVFFSGLSLLAGAHDRPFWNSQDLVNRKLHAENVRISAARFQALNTEIAHQKTNGDLRRYKDRRGSFSKALQHKENGMVEHRSFKSLIKALKSGKSYHFDKIILGGERHLVNPQAAYAYSLEGADVAAYTIHAAPKLKSSHLAAEMVELYWGVLLRDIPFNKFDTNNIAANAIADLNTLSHYRGPKINGMVTAQTLWRGNTPGDLVGPYISQFLYQPKPDLGVFVEQKYFPYVAGVDFLTSVEDLLLVQNGGSTGQVGMFAPTAQYIFTPRDLGTYVHKDYSTEAYMCAALILLNYGKSALDKNNPYKNNPTQDGFVTYGGPKVVELINMAAAAAFKAAWYQKWMVHLRLRPECCGFLVHEHVANGIDYDINEQLINSPVLQEIFGMYGTYLLPQMYPEGSPAHPSYPAGHAAVAGACVTILKAFFDEDFVIPNPLQPNPSDDDLEPYPGELRIGDELNKLAANIGMARDFAGVHYRSDCFEGMLLGEDIALSILQDEAYTNNEPFKGFYVTTFDGKKIKIGKKVDA